MTQTATPKTVLPKRRWARRLVIALSAAGLLFIFVSWFCAFKFTGPRQHLVGDPPAEFPYVVENIALDTGDGLTLRGWFFPTEKHERAIVLLHGYGGDRSTMLRRAKFFREQSYAVLCCDARACGESTGDCITFGYRESDDLPLALKLLRDRGYQRIACLGVSQGGATILFAAHRPEQVGDVRCVICESVYDEMEHAIDRRFRRYLFIPGRPACCLLVPFAEWRTGIDIQELKPVAHIGKLPCPVLLICGDNDNRVFPEDTQALFAAAKEPKELWMIPGAGHEDLFEANGYQEKVTTFLEKHMK